MICRRLLAVCHSLLPNVLYSRIGRWGALRRWLGALRVDSLLGHKLYYRHRRKPADPITADGTHYVTGSRNHDPDGVVTHVCDRIEAESGVPLRVLDLCCGSGRYLAQYRDRFVPERLEGWDISGATLEGLARSLVPEACLRAVDVERLPADLITGNGGVFDLVSCYTSVQYFSVGAIDDIVRNVERLLAPGGTFAVVFPCADLPTIGPGGIGCYCYSVAEWIDLCAKAGLTPFCSESMDDVFSGHWLMMLRREER